MRSNFARAGSLARTKNALAAFRAPWAKQGLEHSMNEDPGREIAIFTQALKLPIHKRAAFLSQACSGDDALRQKLEALLSASERSGDFLEQPAIPGALTAWLREVPIPARRKRRKNPETNFQGRRKKRKEE